MVSRKLEKWILKCIQSRIVWSGMAVALSILFFYPVILHQKFTRELKNQDVLRRAIDDLILSNHRIDLLILEEALNLKPYRMDEFDNELASLNQGLKSLSDLRAATVVPEQMLKHLEETGRNRIVAARSMLPKIRKSFSQTTPTVMTTALSTDRDASRRFVFQAVEFKRAVSIVVDLNAQEKRFYSIDVLLRLSVGLSLLSFFFLYRYQAHLLRHVHAVRSQLRRSRSDLRTALSVKESFLSVLSHRIRTPLNKTVGFIDLLERGELDKQQRQLVENVSIATKTMSRILSAVFNEDGAQTLDGGLQRAFGLRSLAGDLTDIYNATEGPQHCQFDVKLATHRDDTLFGNYNLLLSYLLARVSLVASVQRGSWIQMEISVRNPGTGTVFLEFELKVRSRHSSDHPSSPQHEMVSSKIIDSSAAGLSITNLRDGDDSVFFEIEFAKASTLPTMSSQTEDMLHVLAVDDETMNLVIVDEALFPYGIAVSKATSARKAFELLSRQLVDVVLMDLSMPDLDGLTAVEMIRRGDFGKANADLPIVILTANVATIDRDRSLAAGASAFVEKPFDPQSLAMIIREHEARNIKLDSIALLRLEKIAGLGNTQLVSELFGLALKETPAQIEGLKTALLKRDHAAVKARAHRLRSIAANVGASRLEHFMKILEHEDTVSEPSILCLQLDREWKRAERLLIKVIEQQANSIKQSEMRR